MKKIMLCIFFLLMFSLYSESEIKLCPKCHYENDKENRYCLNCAEEMNSLTEEEIIKLQEKNKILSEERKNNVKKLVETEINNNKIKTNDLKSEEEMLFGKNLDDFPDYKSFKKIQEEFAPQKKLIIQYYRSKKKTPPFYKTLTPVIVKGSIYYHRSELLNRSLVPYGSDKIYYTEQETHDYYFKKKHL